MSKYNVPEIRSLIAKTGLSETDFLHSVGLGAKTLKRWEQGTEKPRDDYALFIACRLGVDLANLVDNENNHHAQQQESCAPKVEKSIDSTTKSTEKQIKPTSKKETEKREPTPPKWKEISPKPTSTILSATLCEVRNEQRGFNMLIVSNEHQQDSDRKIYWVGRALPTMVLSAIQTKDRCFDYKGIKYRVTDFSTFNDADKYLKIVSRFSNPAAPQTIYVFAQKNIAHFEDNRYEMVTAMIPCADRIYPIPASVYYDKEKKQYFINEATYTNLRKCYGLPYLRLQIELPQSTSKWFSVLKPHSELNLLGYNVSASDGLSFERRRRILRDAINSGVLWKRDIMNHLEWLIHMGSKNPNMENAVGEWRSDLMYISQYNATEQRKIWISKFKSKFSEVDIL